MRARGYLIALAVPMTACGLALGLDPLDYEASSPDDAAISGDAQSDGHHNDGSSTSRKPDSASGVLKDAQADGDDGPDASTLDSSMEDSDSASPMSDASSKDGATADVDAAPPDTGPPLGCADRPPAPPTACPGACTGGCEDGVCTIMCRDTEACSNATLECDPTRACRVVCSGTTACAGAEITCPPDAPCRVECSGTVACDGANLRCGARACDATCVYGKMESVTCGSSCACTATSCFSN